MLSQCRNTVSRLRLPRVAVALAAATAIAPRAHAQSDTIPRPKALIVGERLEYDVKFGPIKVGRASMEVVGIEEIRGRRAWHTRFRLNGGTLFYHVDDILESWIDIETFSSLRFKQQLSEGSRDRMITYEIFPERSTYRENDKPEQPSVPRPLDDGSFLYYIRTVDLQVGATYEFPRYFKLDRNPVRLDVLKRENIEVPAGKFDALVVRPVIKAKGVFSEDGKAQIWLSNDSDHVLLQMSSRLKIGSISLHMRARKFLQGTDSASTKSP
jgi:hypothetical protein